MPHDPERIAEVRSWFVKASDDLRAAAAFDPALEALLRRAAPLTEYAWRFRYPGDLNEPPVEEAQEALGIAREVFESLLPGCQAALTPPSIRTRHRERC